MAQFNSHLGCLIECVAKNLQEHERVNSRAGGTNRRHRVQLLRWKHKSAYGFISKDGDAYSLYYATLHTGHQEPSVGLTHDPAIVDCNGPKLLG